MPYYMECGGNYEIKGEKTFGRHIIIPVDQSESIRKRFRNVDVFGTVMCYDSKDQNTANLYGPLYLDLDIELETEFAFKKVKKDLSHAIAVLTTSYDIPLDFIRIYFSGNKGFHVMVDPEVFGIEPTKDLNNIYKAMAVDINNLTMFKTVDTGIYDRVRLFRYPNSINGKTGLYKVPVDYSFVLTHTLQEIKDYALEPKESYFPEPEYIEKAAVHLQEVVEEYNESQKASVRRGSPFIGGKKKILPCIQEILKQGAPQGTRNNTTVLCASALCQSGMDYEDVLTMISVWNETYNVPKLDNKEVERTVRSAYDGVINGKAYGCRAVKELGLCLREQCHIFVKREGK